MPPVTGEIAPALSPLDVFAAQSRALARQLEDSRKNGRRVSRLPPLAVADGLAKKPGFVPAPIEERKETAERDASDPPSASSGSKMEIEDPVFRPKSFYPRFSSLPVKEETDVFESPISRDEQFVTPSEQPMGDYFEKQRTRSPEYFSRPRTGMDRVSQVSNSRPKTSFDSFSRKMDLERGGSVESTSSRMSQFSNTNSLHPPNPPYARKAPSIRSVDSEDDNPGITPSSSFSQYRKFSGSSGGFSAPQSPQSTFASHLHHNRSPSQNSDYSLGGTRLAKPAFNFSRPRSRGMAPVDTPPDIPTPDSHTPRIVGEEDARSTLSREAVLPGEQEEIPELDDSAKTAASSYIYAKYSLPRGRMVSRDSLPLDSLMPKFEWEKASVQSSARPPLQTVDSSQSLTVPDAGGIPRTSTESAPAGPIASLFLSAPASPALPRTSTESAPVVPAPPASPPPEIPHRHSMTSMQTGNSGSTIKAAHQVDRTAAAAAANGGDLTAEEHLTKGIALHERGALSESTYHLRRAARQNSPTAMLLYALACRHGWGMRPHPAEGVTWLRKAMDCASIEMTHMADDDQGDDPAAAAAAAGAAMGGPDAAGRKTRKAQFALSMYELGVSHLNGWGIEQDKALALRCFEIAASWGDADAMAEAGFCYAQGVGARKDLPKAARYYRRAESKGMSMVGNSW